ncbi:MAG: hypothetical protein ACOCZH_02605, partial [Phototrophicaceae bacterium]
PLPADQNARVSIRCARGLKIGGKSRMKLTISGGAVGVIIDARGRPLLTGVDAETRSRRLPLWVGEMTGTTPISIPPSWLEPLAEPDASDETSAAAHDRKDRDAGKKKKKDRKSKKTEQAAGSPFSDDELDELLDDDDELKELRNVLS